MMLVMTMRVMLVLIMLIMIKMMMMMMMIRMRREHLDPGHHLCKDQPNIDHLDVSLRQNISLYKSLCLSTVWGRLLETLMNKVVRTRRDVRFTVTIASKKKSLKKLVA